MTYPTAAIKLAKGLTGAGYELIERSGDAVNDMGVHVKDLLAALGFKSEGEWLVGTDEFEGVRVHLHTDRPHGMQDRYTIHF